MWLLADMMSWSMFILGLGLMIAILMRRWHRYYGPRRRRRQEAPLARATLESKRPPRSLSDAPTDVLRWQVELHETARDLKAELDSKIGALQVLIRMARQEAERLERLTGYVDQSAASENEPRQEA